ncbi:NAD(+)/NADH kinase [Candidatus Poriferisodalis sp.]|uniref:NAD(+)/NADH kinase n=1 Tax=Candidatus Poriferisodalis sp. TaxID=3101277 RepID=UPI003B01FB53
MSGVLVIAHAERAEALAASTHLVDWLEGEGHTVEMGGVEAAAIGRPDLEAGELTGSVWDLAVSVGGDGTMLRSFDLVASAGVPVLGVNVGHLGYLTEFEPGQLTETVAAALAGALGVSERMMVSARVRRAAGEGRDDAGDHDRDPQDTEDTDVWTGLNEVVLEKRDPGHTVRLEVWLDGEVFATYAADGLIVSTPTGSTAYSLSAGGAVVAPTHSSLQVTPVAPHMLFDRSLLLPPDTEIGVRVISERPALAAVDGRSATMLHTGDELVVTRAPYEARLVTAGGGSFHRVLKHKFGLKDR